MTADGKIWNCIVFIITWLNKIVEQAQSGFTINESYIIDVNIVIILIIIFSVPVKAHIQLNSRTVSVQAVDVHCHISIGAVERTDTTEAVGKFICVLGKVDIKCKIVVCQVPCRIWAANCICVFVYDVRNCVFHISVSLCNSIIRRVTLRVICTYIAVQCMTDHFILTVAKLGISAWICASRTAHRDTAQNKKLLGIADLYCAWVCVITFKAYFIGSRADIRNGIVLCAVLHSDLIFCSVECRSLGHSKAVNNSSDNGITVKQSVAAEYVIHAGGNSRMWSIVHIAENNSAVSDNADVSANSLVAVISTRFNVNSSRICKFNAYIINNVVAAVYYADNSAVKCSCAVAVSFILAVSSCGKLSFKIGGYINGDILYDRTCALINKRLDSFIGYGMTIAEYRSLKRHIFSYSHKVSRGYGYIIAKHIVSRCKRLLHVGKLNTCCAVLRSKAAAFGIP